MRKINKKKEIDFQFACYYDIEDLLEMEKKQKVSIISTRSLEDIAREIKEDPKSFIIAVFEEQIIGFVNIARVLDTADLNAIVVMKKFKGQGIGQFILQRAVEFCEDTGIKKIMLEVRASNEIAKHIYEKAGFTKINERKDYYKDPVEDAYIYEIMLPKTKE